MSPPHVMNEGNPSADETAGFPMQLSRLRQREEKAWTELVGSLRQVTLPWLRKRIGRLPAYAVTTEQEFAMEVFSESLSRFFTLFEKGRFEQPRELQSLMFKVAELTLKEGFARLKKEALIYRPDDPAGFQTARQEISEWTNDDELARQRTRDIRQKLLELNENDRDLLCRYYAGEKLAALAREMEVSEENIRKRKQRAFERLKHLVGLAQLFLIGYLWTALQSTATI
ncbi:MAG TPA: sigma-70 family RNA polymerase sigma factor [Saprospiraceae bacterium]|nr:sigma-70 family RNA polymerase sigma factor [Saprospiraceae bacterium]